MFYCPNSVEYFSKTKSNSVKETRENSNHSVLVANKYEND